MAEVNFARQFLTALDSRAIKLSSDHVADPKSFPSQGTYVLPKYPSSPAKRKRTAAGGVVSAPSATTTSVTLKPMKSPPGPLTLPSQDLTTSVHDLKTAFGAHASVPSTKLKVLYNKKPVADSKSLKDLLGDAAGSPPEGMDFTVMVMGGAVGGVPERVASPPVEASVPSEAMLEEKMDVDGVPPAQGQSGVDVLETEEFWTDLKGFLVQRLRDEGEGEKLAGTFREAWRKGRGS